MKKDHVIVLEKKILLSREEAKNLEKEIRLHDSESVVIDFATVNFISRGFADEWLNVMSRIKPENKITFLNQKPSVKKMMQAVQKRKQKIRKELSI
jgi:anti-anti-sigma regulatory factor